MVGVGLLILIALGLITIAAWSFVRVVRRFAVFCDADFEVEPFVIVRGSEQFVLDIHVYPAPTLPTLIKLLDQETRESARETKGSISSRGNGSVKDLVTTLAVELCRKTQYSARQRVRQRIMPH